MIIDQSWFVAPGRQILWRDGKVVWFGDLGAPTEDVDHDRITVNPSDYERIKNAVPNAVG